MEIAAEGAEALVWEAVQRRCTPSHTATGALFPIHAAVLVELHLRRDLLQITSFLHQPERGGYNHGFVNCDTQRASQQESVANRGAVTTMVS